MVSHFTKNANEHCMCVLYSKVFAGEPKRTKPAMLDVRCLFTLFTFAYV